MSIACWLISLEPEKPAVLALRRALTDAGVSVSVFPAVDGRRGPPPLQGEEVLDQAGAIQFRGAPLGGAEIGCYLSHYRLLRKAYDDGLQQVCIVEDDIALDDGFREALVELESLGSEYELVRLMGLRIFPRKVVRGLDCGFDIVRPVRGTMGTQGYVINRSGMEKVLRHGAIIKKPIDKLYDYFWELDLKLYGVEPHVIYEIEHVSSIPKPKSTNMGSSWWSRFVWRVSKPVVSMRRNFYVLSRYRDFSPAELPVGAVGKTRKLR